MLLVTVEEEQGNAVFAVHFTVKVFNQLYITNKTEHFIFKSGCTMSVVELIKKLAYSVTVRNSAL